MNKERNVLSELLEIVLHYILYVRRIYPENFFEKRAKCHLLMWVRAHKFKLFLILQNFNS